MDGFYGDDWPMHDRAVVRNQPGGNSDYIEEVRR